MKKILVSTCIMSLVLLTLPSLLLAEGDVEKGKEAFAQCGICHHTDKTDKKMGPGLKGLFHKDKMANGKKPTEENVIAVINEGGSGMPAYKDILTDEDRADLLAYLKTL